MHREQTTIVIGGGLAGLWLTAHIPAAVCLEASDRVGGRIRSAYADDGTLVYETGPWRIPENHARMLHLCAECGIALQPLATPTPSLPMDPPPVAGLSIWGVNALAHGPQEADRRDLATAYADQTASASGSSPYTTHAGRHWTAPAGFSALAEALAHGRDVRLRQRVVDLQRAPDGSYEVRVCARSGHNEFREHILRADVVFVCVPPDVCRGWTLLAAHAKSVLHAVEAGPLHHIYAWHERPPVRRHVVDSTSLVTQCISSQYGNGWFQASYTAGRVARLWHDLALSNPGELHARLRQGVRRLFGLRLPEGAPVRSHFWPVAYHQWRPVPHFELQRAVQLAVRPSPHHLPRVYLAGEALSSHQAWMEGALETAELALAASCADEFAPPATFRRGPPSSEPSPTDDLSVRVEGHVLDVARWAHVHPGGIAALRNHAGEDVTDLMTHIHHSAHAWAVVHSLKKTPPEHG